MTLEKKFRIGISDKYKIDGYLFGVDKVGNFDPFICITHYTSSAKPGSFPKFLDRQYFDYNDEGRAKGNEIFKALRAKGYEIKK